MSQRWVLCAHSPRQPIPLSSFSVVHLGLQRSRHCSECPVRAHENDVHEHGCWTPFSYSTLIFGRCCVRLGILVGCAFSLVCCQLQSFSPVLSVGLLGDWMVSCVSSSSVRASQNGWSRSKGPGSSPLVWWAGTFRGRPPPTE